LTKHRNDELPSVKAVFVLVLCKILLVPLFSDTVYKTNTRISCAKYDLIRLIEHSVEGWVLFLTIPYVCTWLTRDSDWQCMLTLLTESATFAVNLCALSWTCLVEASCAVVSVASWLSGWWTPVSSRTLSRWLV